MLARAYSFLRLARDLGRAYWLSRDFHIQERLPTTLGPGNWVVLACKRSRDDGPAYATPAMRAVPPGERFWVFVPEGSYWLYAVAGDEPARALREFYADPSSAVPIWEGDAVSARGAR